MEEGNNRPSDFSVFAVVFFIRAVYFVDDVPLGVNERKASGSDLFPCTLRLVSIVLALNNTHA